MLTVDTPLSKLALEMVDAQVHRIIVVDRQNRLVGVVSSMDILAAIARDTALPEG